MQATMKALVKREATKGIWMEQVPMPEIGPNDVLIKLEKTAICGTDLHIYKWDEWSQRVIKPGLVIGHEFVGRIVDMGAGVRGYTLGQRVSAEGHIVCGVCRNCLNLTTRSFHPSLSVSQETGGQTGNARCLTRVGWCGGCGW